MQKQRITTSVNLIPKQKFNPKPYTFEGVTEDDVMDIKESFDLFDENEDGLIQPTELIHALEHLGQEGKKTTIYQIFSDALASNRTAALNFDEFFSMMTSKMTANKSRDDMRKIFMFFTGANDSEKMTVNDLIKVAYELGENLSDQ